MTSHKKKPEEKKWKGETEIERTQNTNGKIAVWTRPHELPQMLFKGKKKQ